MILARADVKFSGAGGRGVVKTPAACYALEYATRVTEAGGGIGPSKNVTMPPKRLVRRTRAVGGNRPVGSEIDIWVVWADLLYNVLADELLAGVTVEGRGNRVIGVAAVAAMAGPLVNLYT